MSFIMTRLDLLIAGLILFFLRFLIVGLNHVIPNDKVGFPDCRIKFCFPNDKVGLLDFKVDFLWHFLIAGLIDVLPNDSVELPDCRIEFSFPNGRLNFLMAGLKLRILDNRVKIRYS